MDQVRVFLSAGAVDGPLKGSIEDLIKTQQDLGNVEQRISTTREQMQAFRTRMDELHAQVLSLRLVRTGASLMRNLEKKLQDVSDKLSQSTVDLAALERRRCCSESISRTAWPSSRSKRRTVSPVLHRGARGRQILLCLARSSKCDRAPSCHDLDRRGDDVLVPFRIRLARADRRRMGRRGGLALGVRLVGGHRPGLERDALRAASVDPGRTAVWFSSFSPAASASSPVRW